MFRIPYPAAMMKLTKPQNEPFALSATVADNVVNVAGRWAKSHIAANDASQLPYGILEFFLVFCHITDAAVR